MNPPRVAVIITFYCSDRVFPEALHSVLTQTRPADEIVVVDDCSPPGASQTLTNLDPRIRLVRHARNMGVGTARQTGADATTSDLIAYLDADDIWLPSKIERQIAEMTAAPDLSAHHVGLVVFRADGSETSYAGKPGRLVLTTQLQRNQPLPSAYMIRRTALTAVGGWSRDRRLMEDWELNIRLLALGHQIGFLPEVLVRFRRTNHGNLSTRGLRHMAGNLGTIWHHRRLYRDQLGFRGTVAVAGRVIHDEGSRRGGLSGASLRAVGWLLRSKREPQKATRES